MAETMWLNTSKSAFVEGECHFEVKWLKGYVYSQHLYTIGYGNGSTTTLPLKVFTQINFVAEVIWFNLIFIYENDKFAF